MTHPARKLLMALRNAEAFGPRRAVAQRVLASRTGIPIRRLQEDVVLELLTAGHAIATTCREPYGRFIARTAAELEPYCTQLESRSKGLYKRRRLVRNVQRSLQAAVRRNGPALAHGGRFVTTSMNAPRMGLCLNVSNWAAVCRNVQTMRIDAP